MIKVKDKEFEISIPSSKIQEVIKGLADRMNADLAGKNPLFLPVLNGSFLFAADLIREVNIDCEVSFIKLSSYLGTSTTGSVKSLVGLSEEINGRTIVIIEDIVDTGITIESLMKNLEAFAPAEIKIATLLFKPDAYKMNHKIDYIGFEVANDFLVGYGLDYDGLGRNLKDIYVLKRTKN